VEPLVGLVVLIVLDSAPLFSTACPVAAVGRRRHPRIRTIHNHRFTMGVYLS
jgi:hypothetical protein